MIKKFKLDKILLVLIFIVSVLLLTLSGIKLLDWKMGKKSAVSQIKSIIEFIDDVDIVNDDKNTEIIPSKVEDTLDPYQNHIKEPMINVDFSRLKVLNNEVKGWIQVNGTNVNYPFVQSKDNEFYLKHSFDKEYNSAGWVFSDYRNKLDGTDKNTILYAHGRADQTMFGSLSVIIKNEWLNNINNHIIKISTEVENSLWQVFSVYVIPTTSDYLQIDFDTNEFQEFANKLMKRSQYNFNTTINETDQIITLSTCYSKTERLVLHAKKIKKQVKTKDITIIKDIYYI